MSVVVREQRELGDECQHWNDEGSRLTGTCKHVSVSSIIRDMQIEYIPVSAIPMMSRFCRPIGMACRWMGEGSL